MAVISAKLEQLIFSHRRSVVLAFVLITALMAYAALQLRIDAGFTKLLPLEHEYMQTFSQYNQEFGGANRILIALVAKNGDIFTPHFFDLLRKTTDEVFFIPGVDRTRVRSLFTPNVRFTEVVEDGIAGGNVIPDDFSPTPDGLATVRKNILKAGILGRLVANDFSGALISVELLDIDPNNGKRLDYVEVAHLLEEKIRSQHRNDLVELGIAVHVIGFAKVVGDIADGAARVTLFFATAFLITSFFVYLYTRSVKRTIALLTCSLVTVVWQLGSLTLLGYGIDPMSVLVPFLVFAIAVSHGVQMVSAHTVEIREGRDSERAARASFRRLLVPGGIALASDTIGFITILLIDIQVIQEMGVTASLGVAAIIFTNLILLPVWLSYLPANELYVKKLEARSLRLKPYWDTLARAAETKPAATIVTVAVGLLSIAAWQAGEVRIGDVHRGVPELHSESRYNVDSRIISERFSIGVDVISTIVETQPEGCINHAIMDTIDRYEWHMRNVEGVQSVVGLPTVAKVINAGWNEGSLKWRVLPRNPSVLAQSVAYVPTSSGLLNGDCSVMAVLIFTADHKAETIDRIVDAVKTFRNQHESDNIKFRLATGNVGVMAATNEEVEAAQYPILIYVFSAVIVLCLLSFRSINAVLCIVLPLGLVSLLAYGLMSVLEIGLKVSTLPVVALGVGIGVDYGIYIYNRLQSFLSQGMDLGHAYRETLNVTGSGVVFTGVTLATGVATWAFSPLKFQADMGILLTFMFLLNMIGAIVLLPALAHWLVRPRKRNKPVHTAQT